MIREKYTHRTRTLYLSTVLGFIRLEITTNGQTNHQRELMKSFCRMLKPLIRYALSEAWLSDEAQYGHIPERRFGIPRMASPTSPAGRLGFQLRIRRLEADLTQEELAALAKLNRTHLSEIERGLRAPRPLTLYRINRT